MFKSLKNCVKSIACITAAITLAAGCSAGKPKTDAAKDYAKDYVDVYGMTAEELADKMGMSYDDFLQYYGLPADLPRDLNSNAVEKTIPVGKIAEMNRYPSFDEFKESMGWDDSITEDTRLGEALDKTQLRYYVGEENLDSFKTEYGFGDEVTADTLYGEIRVEFEEKMKEKYEASKAAAEAEDKDAETAPADTESTDAATGSSGADDTAEATEASDAAEAGEAVEVTEAPAEKQ